MEISRQAIDPRIFNGDSRTMVRDVDIEINDKIVRFYVRYSFNFDEELLIRIRPYEVVVTKEKRNSND